MHSLSGAGAVTSGVHHHGAVYEAVKAPLPAEQDIMSMAQLRTAQMPCQWEASPQHTECVRTPQQGWHSVYKWNLG